jgi:hypothetical protein
MLQTVASSIPDKVSEFYFNLPNSNGRTVALCLTQPLKVNFIRAKARATRKAQNPTAICEPIVYKMCTNAQAATSNRRTLRRNTKYVGC